MVSINNIYKSYDGKNVISKFSATLHRGKILFLMGKSGAGKTSLVNILLGLTKCDSGEILNLPQNISVCFQEDRLLENFSAYANIKLTTNADDSKIANHFKALDIYDSIDEKINKFSGGMKRRIALIRAVIKESDLLILDEPFKGMDEELKLKALRYVEDNLNNRYAIIISHDIEDTNKIHNKEIIYI